ncbi:hypothetical protein, partial [Thiolapillus sp.]|uniref:hypothetical protein n=1 Tax=Thiolapillus sp. TaxID=2017437 RepID=UPI003AF9A156
VALLASLPLCWPLCRSAGLSVALLASLPLCWPLCRSAGFSAALLASLPLCWPLCRSAGLFAALLASLPLCWSSAALLACCVCLGLLGDSRLPFFLFACAWSFAVGGHIATSPLICAASTFSLACLCCPAFSLVVHVDILLINARACVYFISFIIIYIV